MKEALLPVALFWGYCASFGLLARRPPPLLHAYPVHALSAVGFVALLGWSVRAMMRSVSAGPEVILLVCSMAFVGVVGALLAIRYWIFLIGEYFDRAHRSITGVDRMKIRKTYDVAEKLEKEKRWEEALSLYTTEIAGDPSDGEAYRRAAELCLKLERPADAVRWYRTAVSRAENAEDRVTISFRLSEVLVDRLGRAEEAKALLEEVIRDHPGTRFETFARERIERIERGPHPMKSPSG